jgi:hypothetical protein
VEAAALNLPPWLDRLVTVLIPPGAREEVVGDLHESCVTSRQYADQALRIAPFVIASQMRRNLNLPTLIVQCGLLFDGLGAAAALAALPLLLLWDAYRPPTRPSPREALREALFVSFGGVILILLVPALLGMGFDLAAARHGSGLLALFILGMPLSPVLCGFRAFLMVGNDRRGTWAGTDLSIAELSDFRQIFLRRGRRRNLIEGSVLVLAGAGWPMLMRGELSGVALAAVYGITALFVLTEFARSTELRSDFVSLRAHYRRELARQQHLRRFLWWLWLAPALVALQSRAAAGQLTVMQCSFTAMLLCFLVATLNREGEGRMRELVGALERARERHG